MLAEEVHPLWSIRPGLPVDNTIPFILSIATIISVSLAGLLVWNGIGRRRQACVELQAAAAPQHGQALRNAAAPPAHAALSLPSGAAGPHAGAGKQAGDAHPSAQLPPSPEGYQQSVEELRRREFSRLAGRVYADYAGAPPYSETLLAEALADLSSTLHGNPHSEAGWGESRSAAADAARMATLRMCGADPEQYACIFTAGATAALKLVGESFPWTPASCFLHLRDNHTSVLGVRQLAAQHGTACAAAVDVQVVAAGSGSSSGAEGRSASNGWVLVPCSESSAASIAAASAATVAAAAGPAGSAGSESTSEEEQPQHLFAFPLESNFSGARYDPGLVQAVQRGKLRCRRAAPCSSSGGGAHRHSSGEDAGAAATAPLPAGRWRVLLDCAKACATAPPNLAACPADYAVLSFYKIFGWPTGLGALIVRKDALAALRRRYFGGGTVAACLADEPFHSLRSGVAAWEDGTPAFLDLPAVAAGLRFIDRLGGFPAVAAHAGAVAASLARQLSALRHANGAPVCILYSAHSGETPQGRQAEAAATSTAGEEDAYRAALAARLAAGKRRRPGVCGQGPVVAFNLLRADGSFVGYREVEKLASLTGIYLRTGCLCNPGACAAALGLSAADMCANFEAGHVCWDERDVINGRPTGVVRASFGYASSLADADAVVGLALAEPSAAKALRCASGSSGGSIHSIWVYPIKSCRGFSPPAWPLGPCGLLYDRCWALVDASTGAALRLKKHPGLAAIAARVDLQRRLLLISAEGEPEELQVPLPVAAADADGVAWQAEGGAGSRSGTVPAASKGSTVQESYGLGNGSTFAISVCTRTACVEHTVSSAGSEAEVAAWFSRVLGLPCRLVQMAQQAQQAQQEGTRHDAKHARRRAVGSDTCERGSNSSHASSSARSSSTREQPSSSRENGEGHDSPHADTTTSQPTFANEGQLLVVSAASLADLAARSASAEPAEVFAQRFRPNLVVGGAAPYAEDRWQQLCIHSMPNAHHISSQCKQARGSGGSDDSPAAAAGLSPSPACTKELADAAPAGALDRPADVLLVSAGPCARCDMICAHPLTGRRAGPEPLLTLAGYRRSRGRITLGLLMNTARGQQGQRARQEQQQPSQRDSVAMALVPAAEQLGHAAGLELLAGHAWLAVGMQITPQFSCT